ncbi:Smr/MutS family protein [Thalassobaculum sp.]|uniref:Smr/MutS family protein n=1 Tax=Thalassobaculum sp. TaxID=2022740 RepID=UPI0032EB84DC
MTRRRPTPDELALFGRVVSDAEPLKPRRRSPRVAAVAPEPEEPAAASAPAQSPVQSPGAKPSSRKRGRIPADPPPPAPAPPPPVVPAALGEHAHGAAPGLDRRTQLRLKRGQIPIEARIDLHGMSRERAHAGLNAFLARQAALGRRCVLVITGKGRSDWQRPDWGSEERETGVIRRALPGWLRDHPNQERVLAFAAAQPQDGGTGAWYVLLRRRREDSGPGGGPGGGPGAGGRA